MQPPDAPRQTEQATPGRLLPLILALALARGLLYLAVMPPWQHYDEPTHFEYVGLLAQRGRLPQMGDYDLEMRREIAASMQAADFWKDMGRPALDFFSSNPPAIGLTELHHPPLYYLLLALPQVLVRYQDVETQLYVARLGSILFYLVVVAAVYGLAAELFPRRRGLALAAAALVALLPTLTDLMSGVNNDVGAAAATSAYLWAGARLLRRGPSAGRLAAVLVLAGACLAIKSTSGLVAVTGLLVLAGAWLHARRSWLPWAVGGLLLVALGVAALDWQGYAAGWYDARRSGAPQRQRTEAALGDYALVLSASGIEHPVALVQELPPARGGPLAGHRVTLGAWLRGNGEEGQGAELRLRDGGDVQVQKVPLTAEWQFASFTAEVAPGSPSVEVWVAVPAGAPAGQVVHADGLILVSGDYGAEGAPQFTDDGGQRATWGGQAVVNLLRNGSAEAAWPGLRPWLHSTRVYRMGAQEVFHSIIDWQRTGWVYGPVVTILHRSFWGRFGWGHLVLPEAWFYLLAALTIAAAGGVLLGLARRFRRAEPVPAWKRRAFWLVGLSLLVATAGAVLRIHPVDVLDYTFWPAARYLTVAIGPLAIALCAGLVEPVPRRWRALAAGTGLLGLVTLDFIALWTVILPYYYG
jgi:4-amino-4-deoxy-L-arabinose transferase-like glycosyltransferase